MITHEFLITVLADDRTRFNQEPDKFRVELEWLAQKLFQARTAGPVPIAGAVIVTPLVLAERMLKLLDETPEEARQRELERNSF